MKRHDKHLIWARDQGNRWLIWTALEPGNIPPDMTLSVLVPMQDYYVLRAAYDKLKADGYVAKVTMKQKNRKAKSVSRAEVIP